MILETFTWVSLSKPCI